MEIMKIQDFINRVVVAASICDKFEVLMECWIRESNDWIEIENDQDQNAMVVKIGLVEMDWGYIPPFHERLLREKLMEYFSL